MCQVRCQRREGDAPERMASSKKRRRRCRFPLDGFVVGWGFSMFTLLTELGRTCGNGLAGAHGPAASHDHRHNTLCNPILLSLPLPSRRPEVEIGKRRLTQYARCIVKTASGLDAALRARTELDAFAAGQTAAIWLACERR